MQEVQKLRSASPAPSENAPATVDMEALLARIRDELAGGAGMAAENEIWRFHEQSDLRAQFARLERRTTESSALYSSSPAVLCCA
jgi:hypothetical protein